MFAFIKTLAHWKLNGVSFFGQNFCFYKGNVNRAITREMFGFRSVRWPPLIEIFPGNLILSRGKGHPAWDLMRTIRFICWFGWADVLRKIDGDGEAGKWNGSCLLNKTFHFAVLFEWRSLLTISGNDSWASQVSFVADDDDAFFLRVAFPPQVIEGLFCVLETRSCHYRVDYYTGVGLVGAQRVFHLKQK